MVEPLPDPRLRRVMEQLDATKRQLRAERIRSAHLQLKVNRLTALRTNDAKPSKSERRPAC